MRSTCASVINARNRRCRIPVLLVRLVWPPEGRLAGRASFCLKPLHIGLNLFRHFQQCLNRTHVVDCSRKAATLLDAPSHVVDYFVRIPHARKTLGDWRCSLGHAFPAGLTLREPQPILGPRAARSRPTRPAPATPSPPVRADSFALGLFLLAERLVLFMRHCQHLL
jgi:hypothetical protein